MQSPWLRDVSRACSSSCCPNAFVGFPDSKAALTPEISGSVAAASRHEFEICTVNSLYPNSQFTNHESIPPMEESFSCFKRVYPQYSQMELADEIRAEEYYHLSLSKHVCLDYIGHGLFSYSQLQTQHPGSTFFDISYKSVNLTSHVLYGTGEESEFHSDIRKRIMAFMNISETNYSMVLTANQSSAFKLLSESYPFHSGQNLVTVYDYQSEAVEVMIESSRRRGANVMSADFSWPNLQIQTEKLRKKLVSKSKNKRRGLFVFPLQSWVTGSRYSYLWMSLAQENGWHVLLDASALGAKDMETLGLSLFNPDFLICTFFKVCGQNPSGFCCLFIKKSSAEIFKAPATGTATSVGIVHLVPARIVDEFPVQHNNGEFSRELRTPQRTEQNSKTVSLSEIEQVMDTSPRIECRSLDHADSIGLIQISSRTRKLINWLVNALMSLRHPNSDNGIHAVKIYGPKIMFDRGPAVAFNVFDWKGERIDPALVQKLADRNNISLSIGFLQHIWFSDKHEEKELETRTSGFERTVWSKKRDKLGTGISVVTAALSFLTNFEDVYRVWAFVSRFLDADFLEREKWRYKSLNQNTLQV